MRRLNHEDGTVIIIVALSMTVLLGMGALAVDVGALFVRQHQLQTGADAAALAVAKRCVDSVIADEAWLCNATQALSTATSFFNDNTAVTPTVEAPVLDLSDSGHAGLVTVTASYEEPPMLSWAISDGGGPVTVAATATAGWGPITAVDDVFPLAVCMGALPEPGDSVTLWSSPSGDEMTGRCDGAPDALPMGWLTPSNPSRCTTDVVLQPPDDLDIAPSDTPPSGTSCDDAIDDLVDALDWWVPGSERTRVLAVYDASSGSGGPHPPYSLVGFEFTGARLSDREDTVFGDWSTSDAICRPDDTTYSIDELQCIRGTVTHVDAPAGGTIIDPSALSLPGIVNDTTVLDVRLVD